MSMAELQAQVAHSGEEVEERAREETGEHARHREESDVLKRRRQLARDAATVRYFAERAGTNAFKNFWCGSFLSFFRACSSSSSHSLCSLSP